MKKFIGVAFLCFLLFNAGCSSQPKGFTYKYNPEKYTGLDTLINIQGYYKVPYGCDEKFYSLVMFYPNGLVTIATDDDTYGSPKDIPNCFRFGGTVAVCQYPEWGLYEIKQDTIKTQVIDDLGWVYGKRIVYRNYLILQNKELQSISDYISIDMKIEDNGGRYIENPCPKPAEFYSSESKRDTLICPWLKKKWFFEVNKSNE